MMLLAAELARSGLEVSTLTVAAGPLGERLDDAELPWSTVRLPRSLMVYGHGTYGGRALRAALALPFVWVRYAWRLRATTDLLHVNNLRGVLILGPAAKLARVPVVWHVHLTDRMRVLNRLAAKLSSEIVLPSAAEIDNLIGVSARAVRIVPNCVPPEVLNAPPVQGGSFLVVTAARITPQKGIDILLKAMSQVVAQVPDARLLVLGDTQTGYEDHASEVERSTSRLGLEGIVTFGGYVERPHEHWTEASVYVQPSRFEILPMAVLEAMASGLPVVASAVGGMAELVVHERTGLLVPPGDADQLARAIVALLSDPGRAHDMGQAGRALAASRYTVEAMTAQVLEAYRGVAKHGRSRSEPSGSGDRRG